MMGVSKKNAVTHNTAIAKRTRNKKSDELPPPPVLKGFISYRRQFSYSTKVCMTKGKLNGPTNINDVNNRQKWNLFVTKGQIK